MHQWLKNLILFLPILLSHKLSNWNIDLRVILAFLAFCAGASATYLINDLRDIDSDRNHPSKSLRPIAKGLISSRVASIAAILLILVSVSISLTINQSFLLWLVIYLILTICYSIFLKKFIILDLILITIFYLIRIFAGSQASNVHSSYWMFGFSTFFFLSLAFGKRYAELIQLEENSQNASDRRGYRFADRPVLMTLGVASGYAAVVIFALYLDSTNLLNLYHAPQILWGLIPVLTYWISWIWIQATRGLMYEDPLLFAFDKKESRITIVIAVIILVLASTIHWHYQITN